MRKASVDLGVREHLLCLDAGRLGYLGEYVLCHHSCSAWLWPSRHLKGEILQVLGENPARGHDSS